MTDEPKWPLYLTLASYSKYEAVEIRVNWVGARSREEAIGLAHNLNDHLFPTRQGWTFKSVSAERVPRMVLEHGIAAYEAEST